MILDTRHRTIRGYDNSGTSMELQYDDCEDTVFISVWRENDDYEDAARVFEIHHRMLLWACMRLTFFYMLCRVQHLFYTFTRSPQP